MKIALDLFARYGVKSVSMDQIASRGNISKRTLYEYFEDKETLLAETLKLNYLEQSNFIKKLEQDSETAIDLYYYLFEKIMEIPRWYSPKFYDDIRKYPKAREVREAYKEEVHEMMLKSFRRGVDEGVFYGDLNFDILVRFTIDYVKMLRPSQTYSKYSAKEVYTTTILVFIRGICTAKGHERLDRHIRKSRYDLKSEIGISYDK